MTITLRGLRWLDFDLPRNFSSSDIRHPNRRIWSTLDKNHRFFIDCEHDAPGFTGDTVGSSRRVDAQGTSPKNSVRIPLIAGEYQKVLVTFMHMQRDGRLFMKTQNRCRWTRQTIAVKTMDLHSVAKGLPFDTIRIGGNAEEIIDFDMLKWGVV